jgi:hypothetical protein
MRKQRSRIAQKINQEIPFTSTNGTTENPLPNLKKNASYIPVVEETAELESSVNDTNTDDFAKRIVYLSYVDQIDLSDILPFVKVIPWNSFARKNIGYLYAIAHGAKFVWDFDDDNALEDKEARFYSIIY